MNMKKDFFDELGETILRTTRDLGKKADRVYEIQKMRNRIAREEHMVNKLYMEIGRTIFKKYQEEGLENETIEKLCKEIEQHSQIISGYKDSMGDLKGQKTCPVCGKTLDKDAAFCAACGAPVDAEDTSVEDAWDDVPDSAFEDENEGEANAAPEDEGTSDEETAAEEETVEQSVEETAADTETSEENETDTEA